MPVNTFNVVWMLYKEYIEKHMELTEVSKEEIHIKNQITQILKEYENKNDNVIADNEITLDIASSSYEETDCDSHSMKDSVSEYEDSDSSHVDYLNQSDNEIPTQYKKNVLQFWRSAKGNKKRRNFKSVQHKFKNVRCVRQLYHWEKKIQKAENRKQSMKELKTHTFKMFQDARRQNMNVHDADLKRWASLKAAELGISFRGSKNWLNKFKKNYRIVSRKITKIVSQSENNEKTTAIQQSALGFVNEVNTLIKHSQLTDDQVFNADQSSFSKELHSGRTLGHIGEKHILSAAQSVSSTTHTYTIMPTISKSGKLLSPLFIVYPEVKGKFTPNVKKSMFQANNIYTVATKSGKMGNKELETWLSNVYFQNTSNTSLLIVDAWSAFKNKLLIENATPLNKTFRMLNMPPKTTSLIQPLDKYGFRLWKNFVRKFSDIVLLEQYPCDLFQRNNIFKLQSLTHNQFSSPRYIKMWKYSWHACGYSEIHPGYFDNPVNFAFDNDSLINCTFFNCGLKPFAKCSWCKSSYCFNHFFTQLHLCCIFNP